MSIKVHTRRKALGSLSPKQLWSVLTTVQISLDLHWFQPQTIYEYSTTITNVAN